MKCSLNSALSSLIGAALLFGLSGCASQIPEGIRESPPTDPGLAAVRKDISRFIGAQIRWGGVIVKTENLEAETWVELVVRELDGKGRPRALDRSEGRFLARMEGFVDPSVFASGRLLTISGIVEKSLSRPIQKYRYEYPVVRVQVFKLWPIEPEPASQPFYYDPFLHHPWYPYRYPWQPYYRR